MNQSPAKSTTLAISFFGLNLLSIVSLITAIVVEKNPYYIFIFVRIIIITMALINKVTWTDILRQMTNWEAKETKIMVRRHFLMLKSFILIDLYLLLE